MRTLILRTLILYPPMNYWIPITFTFHFFSFAQTWKFFEVLRLIPHQGRPRSWLSYPIVV